MSASKFPKILIKRLLKQFRRLKKASGFTLLELLVALILTFLIITPLLSLVISLMNTDRQEQAKNSSQQEIQAALNYMAQDLQQAVYIYDAAALSKSRNSNPEQAGILSEIPPRSGAVANCSSQNECVPVLAFWKRKFFDRNDKVNGVTIGEINDGSEGSDRFVYSLVVYYLIKDSNSGGNPNNTQTWSPIARIGRFEVRDGAGDASKSPYLQPDPGFARFDLSKSPGSLQQSLNSWTKGSASYTQQVEILVDYIDDTLVSNMPQSVQSQINVPRNNRTDPNYGTPASTECDNRLVGPTMSRTSSTPLPIASRVPPDTIIPTQLNTGSFYACVKPVNDQGQSVAQIYLRGNALPRLNNNSQTWQINDKNLSYAPIANVRVAVRGLLGGNSQ